jgi:hypothetical protein
VIRAHVALVGGLWILGVLGDARLAGAEAVVLPGTQAVVDVPAGWRSVEVAHVLAGWHGPAGELLAITRAAVPNTDAWRTPTRDAYVAQIERGIARSVRGYRKQLHKLATINGVPVLDVEASRGDGAKLVIRILLFRTYALALAIGVPRARPVSGARAIAQSFTPPR